MGVGVVVACTAEQEFCVQIDSEFICPCAAITCGIGIAKTVITDESRGQEVYLLAGVFVALVAGEESCVEVVEFGVIYAAFDQVVSKAVFDGLVFVIFGVSADEVDEGCEEFFITDFEVCVFFFYFVFGKEVTDEFFVFEGDSFYPVPADRADDAYGDVYLVQFLEVRLHGVGLEGVVLLLGNDCGYVLGNQVVGIQVFVAVDTEKGNGCKEVVFHYSLSIRPYGMSSKTSNSRISPVERTLRTIIL